MRPTDLELDLPVDPEAIRQELVQRNSGYWVTASLSPRSTWVVNPTKVWFRSRYFYLMPLEGEAPAYVATRTVGNETMRDTIKVISAFLAGLSWGQRMTLAIEHCTGGDMPRPMGYNGATVSVLHHGVDRDYIPDPQEEKARLALAFYREGLSITHTFYSFLSFYKIINIIKAGGKEQIAWMNSKLDQLSHFAKDRLQELSHIKDIGNYLYTSGRCAVSYAWDEPIADPDDPEDHERLRKDKVLIKELAEIVIEEELGPRTTSSQYKLGNISGIIEMIGQENIDYILNTNPDDEREIDISIPYIQVCVRGKQPYKVTEKLFFVRMVGQDKMIFIDTLTEDQRAMVRLTVDLEENDIFIDPFNQIFKTNPAHDQVNAEIELSVLRLCRDYLMNGQLRLYAPDGSLLASAKPFMPLNIDVGRSVRKLNQDIEEAERKLTSFAEQAAAVEDISDQEAI